MCNLKGTPLPWKIQIYLKKFWIRAWLDSFYVGFVTGADWDFFPRGGGELLVYIYMGHVPLFWPTHYFRICLLHKITNCKILEVCAQNSAPLIRANKTNIYRTIMNILQNWVYLYLDTVHFIWFCYCLSKFNFWTL